MQASPPLPLLPVSGDLFAQCDKPLQLNCIQGMTEFLEQQKTKGKVSDFCTSQEIGGYIHTVLWWLVGECSKGLQKLTSSAWLEMQSYGLRSCSNGSLS